MASSRTDSGHPDKSSIDTSYNDNLRNRPSGSDEGRSAESFIAHSRVMSLMSAVVKTVSVNDSVDQIEAFMQQHGLHCVPVLNAQQRCFGVISAADLVLFHAAETEHRQRQAWEVCTHNVIQVSPETLVHQAAEIMVNQGVHHLLMVEPTDGTLLGMVSALDLLREIAVIDND